MLLYAAIYYNLKARANSKSDPLHTRSLRLLCRILLRSRACKGSGRVSGIRLEGGDVRLSHVLQLDRPTSACEEVHAQYNFLVSRLLGYYVLVC